VGARLVITRNRQVLKQKKRLLILCEGAVTEVTYFDGLRRDNDIPRKLVRIEGLGLDPKSLVDVAVRMKEDNLANFPHDRQSQYDQVWCVFDRDSHKWIPEAKQKAIANGIRYAFSNPNFELFLLLHFEECNKDLHRTKVTRMLRKWIPSYDKSFEYEALKPGIHDARKRSQVINGRAEVVGQIESAPFTSAFDLVDEIAPPSLTAKQRKGPRSTRAK
jgi:hypothetical protein